MEISGISSSITSPIELQIYVVSSKAGAIACMLLSLLCLGTWPALFTLLERRGRLPQHTYLDYSITNLLAALFFALTFGEMGKNSPSSPNFLSQLSENWPSVLFAVAGGLMLSLGNLCTQYALAFLGLSLNEVITASMTVVIDQEKKKELSWEKRLLIITGTAQGLKYLHSDCQVRIIHRDIKASNILLDLRYKPKISDFGLARFHSRDHSLLNTAIAGTFGYIAPEFITSGRLTEKVDVYSFGVLVIEIVTGVENIKHDDEDLFKNVVGDVWEHFQSNTLEEIIDKSMELEIEKNEEIKRVIQMGLLCTQESPDLRPRMSKVVEMLRNEEVELVKMMAKLHEIDELEPEAPNLGISETEDDAQRQLSAGELSGSQGSSDSKEDKESKTVVDCEIEWDELMLGEDIGQGSYVVVYRGMWNGSDVAVKLYFDTEYKEET